MTWWVAFDLLLVGAKLSGAVLAVLALLWGIERFVDWAGGGDKP